MKGALAGILLHLPRRELVVDLNVHRARRILAFGTHLLLEAYVLPDCGFENPSSFVESRVAEFKLFKDHRIHRHI